MGKVVSGIIASSSILAFTTLLVPVAIALAPKSTANLVVDSRPTAIQDYVYQLGSRRVRIPPPSGFAEAFSQSDLLARILVATEDPNNEVLTAHVPVEVLNRLKKGEPPELDLYTKVSVFKLAKARDIAEAEFATLVAHFESTSPRVLDINGPVMKSTLENARRGLSDVTGKEVPLEMEQPTNLGSFERSKKVYSLMMVINFKTPSNQLPLLCGISLVNVSKRLLYVYTYRKLTTEKDAELLRDFTREWVGQIVSSNR